MDTYDFHLMLRIDDPEEASVAQTIWDTGTRQGKAFMCRCILQALDSKKNAVPEDKPMRDLLELDMYGRYHSAANRQKDGGRGPGTADDPIRYP